MEFSEIIELAADNWGNLADDDSTFVEGAISQVAAKRNANNIYREDAFVRLSDKFPEDFLQISASFPTYTASFIADTALSTGTNLGCATNVFSAGMEELQLYNETDDEFAKIVTVVNQTNVTLDTTIDDTWDGDQIYILGNEFTVLGDAIDMKEPYRIRIKYSPSDSDWSIIRFSTRKKEELTGLETWSKVDPIGYPTMVNVYDPVNSVYNMTKAIGILPYPDSIGGDIILEYIKKPRKMEFDDDKPLLDNLGMGQVIVEGLTAWGFRMLGQREQAMDYEMRFEAKLNNLILHYKPKNRVSTPRVRLGAHYANIMHRNY